MSSDDRLPIIIIGAGVAGLAIGQGLLQHRIPFQIFEANSRSGVSQGHRFRLSQDALDVLHSVLAVDLQDLLRATQANPSRFQPRYVDAKVLQFPEAAPVDVPNSMPVDRAWLRSLLGLNLGDSITYEKRFEKFELEEDHVRVYFDDETAVKGRLVIGADGIKSRVRRQLQPDRQLLDLERNIMWGRTIITSTLKESLPADLFSWLMVRDKDKNRQLVIEPMEWSGSVKQKSDGRLPDMQDYVYWALGTAASGAKLQSPEEKSAYIMDMVSDWHPCVKLLLDCAKLEMSACVRVLSSKPDIGAWSAFAGKVTLIGDAAHPMSPMGGAGADTSLKDAAELCEVIKNGLFSIDVASFEEGMRKRAEEKIMHSFQNGEKFWDGKKWFEYEQVQL